MLWWCHGTLEEDLASPQKRSWPLDVSWCGWGSCRSPGSLCHGEEVFGPTFVGLKVLDDVMKTWNPWWWPWCPYKDYETHCLFLTWLDDMLEAHDGTLHMAYKYLMAWWPMKMMVVLEPTLEPWRKRWWYGAHGHCRWYSCTWNDGMSLEALVAWCNP